MRLIRGRRTTKGRVVPYLPLLHDYPLQYRLAFYRAIGAWRHANA